MSSEMESERKRMPIAVENLEPHELIRLLADPIATRFSVKAALNSAAERLRKHNWSRNRVKDVWYRAPRISVSEQEREQLIGEATSVPWVEVEPKIVLTREERVAADEIKRLWEKISKLEAQIMAQGSIVAGNPDDGPGS